MVKKLRIFYRRSILISRLACSCVQSGRLALNESIPQLASHRRIMTTIPRAALIVPVPFVPSSSTAREIMFDTRETEACMQVDR